MLDPREGSLVSSSRKSGASAFAKATARHVTWRRRRVGRGLGNAIPYQPYEKVPCLGHPVFNAEAVNYDPRERAMDEVMREEKHYNVFLDVYHRLARGMMEQRAACVRE